MELNELYNEDAEQSILGIMMVDNHKASSISYLLDVSDFFIEGNRLLFSSIVELVSKYKPADIVSVSEKLKFENHLEKVGGRDYINLLASNVITTANYKQLCKIIIKYSKKRKLIYLLDKTKEQLEKGEDIDNAIEHIKTQSELLMLNKTDNNLTSILTGVTEVMDEIDTVLSSETKTFGLSTGFKKIDNVLSGLCKSKLYILGARPRVGKALSLDTNILTPTGWVKNRDIKLGDTVIGRDGKPTKVVGVYPQGITNNYTLTLKDGRTIDCCEDHEWTVYSSKWGRERTFTTKELYNKIQCVRYKNNISLPRFTGDYGTEKNFIIPPYVMGVLIGDGCLTRGMCYCKPNIEILNKVQSLLPNSDVHFGGDNNTVYITDFIEGLNYIRKIGLNTQSYNKFIPQEYFHSSKKQREELFNGLIDTDGFKFNTGWEYSTTSRQLALDVQQLAWSLGYCAKIVTRMGKYKKDDKVTTTRLNYRVFITTHNPLTIVDIQPTKSFETQCIHVDNKDHLFVIEDYIVTHNSALAQQIAENISANHNVLFHSLEMKSAQYTKRSVFRLTGLNNDILTNGRVTVEDAMNRVAEASEQLSKLNLYIDDNSECNLTSIEKNINKMIDKKGSCDLIVIDYLQLMGSNNKKVYDRFEVVSNNSRGLKRLANKYNVPILCLCQLSRQLEQRQDKRPILADLRDSGDIEQDADVVMFLSRDELYTTNPMSRGKAELIIAKNREGTCRMIPMLFNSSKTQFLEGSN